MKDAEPADVFMTAASPGVIAAFLANNYYPTDEEYIFALADAMEPEYDAIAAPASCCRSTVRTWR